MRAQLLEGINLIWGHSFNRIDKPLVVFLWYLSASGKLFELLVRVFDTFILTHDRLHRLCEQLEVLVQFSSENFLIDSDPIESSVEAFK